MFRAGDCLVGQDGVPTQFLGYVTELKPYPATDDRSATSSRRRPIVPTQVRKRMAANEAAGQ